MTGQSPEADAAVAREFGIGADRPDGEEHEEQDQEEAQVADEVAFEDLPAHWQDEIRRLRRESAAKRVARRDSQRRETSNGDTPTAPSSQTIAAAEARGRQAALMESGIRLAAAEVKASLSDVMSREQIKDFVEGLDLGRFVEDDGTVDVDAVQDWRERVGSLLGNGKKPAPRVGAGHRQAGPVGKSSADLFGEWLTQSST